MADLIPLIIATFSFLAVAGIVFVIGQYHSAESRLRQRFSAPGTSAQAKPKARDIGSNIANFVSRHFDEKTIGFDDTFRGKLRLTLVRAGYFRHDAINFYVLWRLLALVLVPLLGYLLSNLLVPHASILNSFVIMAGAVAIGVVGPDAFISRRQTMLSAEYRILFPDFLDLLVVCIDAGLTLETAMDRVTRDFGGRRSRMFGINLALLSAEMRAGRSFIDGLNALADRLMIPEARALVALLRQSLELGSDVGEALRVYSDEMRERRLLRAEEQANKLSVKMILPLALFIMPVVLIVVLLPVGIRLVGAFR